MRCCMRLMKTEVKVPFQCTILALYGETNENFRMVMILAEIHKDTSECAAGTHPTTTSRHSINLYPL